MADDEVQAMTDAANQMTDAVNEQTEEGQGMRDAVEQSDAARDLGQFPVI